MLRLRFPCRGTSKETNSAPALVCDFGFLFEACPTQAIIRPFLCEIKSRTVPSGYCGVLLSAAVRCETEPLVLPNSPMLLF